MFVAVGPLAGLLGAALALPQQWAAGRAELAAALVTVLAALLLTRHVRRYRLSHGELHVDAQGHALWQGVNTPAGCGFAAQRWFGIAGLVWIEGEADGQRHRLIFSRDATRAEDWVRLQRWLVWLDRGGVACKSAPTSPSAAREG